MPEAMGYNVLPAFTGTMANDFSGDATFAGPSLIGPSFLPSSVQPDVPHMAPIPSVPMPSAPPQHLGSVPEHVPPMSSAANGHSGVFRGGQCAAESAAVNGSEFGVCFTS